MPGWSRVRRGNGGRILWRVRGAIHSLWNRVVDGTKFESDRPVQNTPHQLVAVTPQRPFALS